MWTHLSSVPQPFWCCRPFPLSTSLLWPHSPKLFHKFWLNRIKTNYNTDRRHSFFIMFLLQCRSNKCDEKSLKLAAIQHQENKRAESTQPVDPLGTTCRPLVEKHCIRGCSAHLTVCMVHVHTYWKNMDEIWYYGSSLKVVKQI